jgi:Fe-S-cluster containining protein
MARTRDRNAPHPHTADPHGATPTPPDEPRRPPRPALGLPLLPDGRYALPEGNPCEGCDHCCRYVALAIPTPRTRRDFDEIRWYVLHEGVSVYVDWEGDWGIQFETKCRWLSHGRCSHYELRPRVCRDYDPAGCQRYVTGAAERVLIRNEQDLGRYLEERERRLAGRRRARRGLKEARKAAGGS